MAADQLLAKQYVEFFAKGIDTVQGATDKYREKLEQANRSADLFARAIDNGSYAKAAAGAASLNQRIDQLNATARKIDLEAKFGKVGAMLSIAQEKIAGLRSGAESLAGPAAAGFAALTGGVLGFVRAGLQGTAEGNRLNLQMTLLSRQIAGVFLPAVEMVTSKIAAAVNWFRSLSGAKQELIMKFVLAAAAGLLVAAVMPKILGGINLVITGVKLLMGVLAAVGVEAGVASGGILPLIGILVTAGVALGTFFAGTRQGGAALAQLEQAGQRLATSVLPLLDRAMTQFGNTAERVLPMVVRLVEAIVNPIIRVLDAIEKLNTALDKADKKFAWMGRNVRPLIGHLTGGLLGPKSEPLATDKKRHDVAPAAGGFEDFMGTFRRVAQASASVAAKANDPQERTAKGVEDLLEETRAANHDRRAANVENRTGH